MLPPREPPPSLVCFADSAALLEHARAFAAAHARHGLTIVAETRIAADEVIRSMPGGALGVQRHILSGLAAGIARPLLAEQELTPLPLLGVEALAARVTTRLHAEGRLTYLDPVADTPGFPRALAATLTELRLNAVSAAQLAPAAPDLAALLAAYQQELETEGLADFARLLELAEQSAGPRHALLLLDPNLGSALEERFVAALARQAQWVSAVVHADDQPAIERLSRALAVEPRTSGPDPKLRLFEAAAAEPCRADFAEIFSAASDSLECVEIARRIHAQAEAGRRFDDMAVLLRDAGRYQAPLEEAFRRAGIPVWFSHGAVRPDPAGRAFLALLDCARERCSASAFAQYVSFGQAPEPPGVEGWAPPKWERLVVDAAVIGGPDRWQRRLNGLRQELERRTGQERRIQQLDHLAQFALPLIGRLSQLSDPPRRFWGEWFAALAELARAALRSPDPVLAMFEDLQQMAGIGPVSLEEVLEVLAPGLRNLRQAPPARRYGHVAVLSIEEARAVSFGVVFVPGMAEGAFPKRALEDPLLLDRVRETLHAGMARQPDRIARERLLLRLAVSAARDKLIGSYPRLDALEGRPRVPSFYALEIARCAAGRLPKLREFEERARAASRVRLGWPAPSAARDAIDDAEYDLAHLDAGGAKGSARYLVEANAHLSRSIRARWRRWEIRNWNFSDGLVADPADFDTPRLLVPYRLAARPYSPSMLERYARCPYQFALAAIHRLRPPDSAEALEFLDAGTRGLIFHQVQRRLFERLRDRDLLPVRAENESRVEAEAEAVLRDVAAECQEELAPAIPRVWKSGIEDLMADLRAWIHDVARGRGEWTPVAAEQDFDVEMEDGVRLRGAIDLLEQHQGSPWLRITDYKTGRPPGQLPNSTGRGEVLQPLLYALAAERMHGVTVRSGRLYYATRRGGFVSRDIYLSPEHRLDIADVLHTIDRAVSEGFLPPVPAEGACGECEFHLVCGPYEDARFKRKTKGEERIKPLVQIRSIP